MKILFGTIMFLLGVGLIFFNEKFVNFAGRNSWAEGNMQIWGGSRTLYKLIGLGLILLGLLLITGLYDNFARSLVSPLIPSNPQF